MGKILLGMLILTLTATGSWSTPTYYTADVLYELGLSAWAYDINMDGTVVGSSSYGSYTQGYVLKNGQIHYQYCRKFGLLR